MLSYSMSRMLKILNAWGGDLPPYAEDTIGCHGAAFWRVVDALVRRGLVTVGPNGTYPLTDAGRLAAR